MINEAKAVAARMREGWTYGLLSEAADTIDALVAEVAGIQSALDNAGMIIERLQNQLHSATRSADSAEPFCDTTPNHFCGNRWVHLPRGEQCDKCGGEV